MKLEEQVLPILIIGFVLVMASMLLSGAGIPRMLLIIGVLVMNVGFWLIFKEPKGKRKIKKRKKQQD